MYRNRLPAPITAALRLLALLVAVLLVGPVLTRPLLAQCTSECGEKVKLQPNLDPYDNFGFSVAVDKGTAVVGARLDDDGASEAGAAYVYVRTGSLSWPLQQKLIASDAATDARFGSAVAISTDTIVVGAPNAPGTPRRGAAYVFTRTGGVWTQAQKLVGSDTARGDAFGGWVAVDQASKTVVVGANQKDSYRGAAYVFVESGGIWSQQAKLISGDPDSGDVFGTGVAVSGDYLVAGAPDDGGAGANAGAAYVFERSGAAWNQVAKLASSDIAGGDQFGSSVSINGSTVAVGAWYKDLGAIAAAGAAYVFDRTSAGWTESAKLTACDPDTGFFFGQSIDLDGEEIIVGGFGDDHAGFLSGSAHVFRRKLGVWDEERKLVASDAQTGHEFGARVGISGDDRVVGALGDPGDPPPDDYEGAAYIFAPACCESFTPIVPFVLIDPEAVDPAIASIIAISLGAPYCGQPGAVPPGDPVTCVNDDIKAPVGSGLTTPLFSRITVDVTPYSGLTLPTGTTSDPGLFLPEIIDRSKLEDFIADRLPPADVAVMRARPMTLAATFQMWNGHDICAKVKDLDLSPLPGFPGWYDATGDYMGLTAFRITSVGAPGPGLLPPITIDLLPSAEVASVCACARSIYP